jgi:nucleoside-triphosphatase THEP1
MTIAPDIPAFAAAVYKPGTIDRKALSRFVEQLLSRNTRVAGILQETILDSSGEVIGLNAVDISNNSRLPISRPTKNDDECGLDVSALVETAGIIRKAISDRVDLVVVEKFGEQEQGGKGLNDEILQTIAADIPLLIAVPEAALPIWQDRTGELGSVLPFDEEAFRQWWHGITGMR